MGIAIKETFRVAAPVDRVWRYLVDPHQVVTCLPGAELTGDEGERVYLGKVKVKVGPVTASYAGRARLTEVNDAEHVVRMDAEGREAGGAGSAKLRMTSRVDAHADGGAEVRVDAEVDVAGKIVQFGRGMIESVSKQLFREFVTCVRARLESPQPASRPPAERAPAAAATSPAASATQSPSTGSASARSPDMGAQPAGVTPRQNPAQGAKPVAVLPLVVRALRTSLSGWLSRFLRRRPARS